MWKIIKIKYGIHIFISTVEEKSSEKKTKIIKLNVYILSITEIIHDAATRGLSFVPRFSLDEKAVSNLAKQLTDKICLMHKSNSEIG